MAYLMLNNLSLILLVSFIHLANLVSGTVKKSIIIFLCVMKFISILSFQNK